MRLIVCLFLKENLVKVAEFTELMKSSILFPPSCYMDSMFFFEVIRYFHHFIYASVTFVFEKFDTCHYEVIFVGSNQWQLKTASMRSHHLQLLLQPWLLAGRRRMKVQLSWKTWKTILMNLFMLQWTNIKLASRRQLKRFLMDLFNILQQNGCNLFSL